MTTDALLPDTAALRQPDELLLGFARALRAAGLSVTQDRAQAFLRAAALVGVDDPHTTYWAGRATLCTGPDDLERYDQVFHAWGVAQERRGGPPQEGPDQRTVQADLVDDRDSGGEEQPEDAEELAATASATEVLRHRDIGVMDAAEKARLAALFGSLRPRSPRRTANRRTAWHRGDLDAARTLRRMRARMGEPGPVAWRRRRTRARRVVLLVDVSGSMSPYADALLRFAHAAVRARPASTEVFTIGTRLTRVTRELRLRDPDRALAAGGSAIPDWSGGTRLGEVLKAFLDRWGQRGTARGAIVVICSDGWERGGTELLGEQMTRLQRLAHSVVWVNPHKGRLGYEPLTGGMQAALPSVDHFVAGHSLAAFEELVKVMTHA